MNLFQGNHIHSLKKRNLYKFLTFNCLVSWYINKFRHKLQTCRVTVYYETFGELRLLRSFPFILT